MNVRLRLMDGSKEMVLPISRLASVRELKTKVMEVFSFEENTTLKLFHKGKSLTDKNTLFDYNVKFNEVIQVAKMKEIVISRETSPVSDADISKLEDLSINDEALQVAESPYYKVGFMIDCKCDSDNTFGQAWFEAAIVGIFKKDNSLVYKVKWGFDNDIDPFLVPEKYIRPRSRKLLSKEDLEKGSKVLVNYNLDEKDKLGFWYDFTVDECKDTFIVGYLHTGLENINGCQVFLEDGVYAIESPKHLSELTEEEQAAQLTPTTQRKTAPNCSSCNDDPQQKCRECGCQKCASKSNPNELLICDECGQMYHMRCLTPPLETLPEDDDWYCPDCKRDANEVVKEGDKLRNKKKPTKPKNGSKRDWGTGMACVGRSRVCDTVSENHVGSVPGIEVGTSWKYRILVSEDGIHRPHVAGIHGRSNDCAYSIVLSGGYEDDIDNGEEFLYTGAGGRDLSNNKRTAKQSCDQTLIRTNLALARNCDAGVDESGAVAKNWQDGKPVRVVRSSKLAKHSSYAPQEGFRYDGLYKVVKYYQQKGKSGFLVWRYLLRRDDPTPAPWTAEGKRLIAEKNLTIKYPEGYIEAQKFQRESAKDDKTKRKHAKSTEGEPPAKKRKSVVDNTFKVNDDLRELIGKDSLNKKHWDECLSTVSSYKDFLDKVSVTFMCICCMSVVYKPVILQCKHIVCSDCLQRNFETNMKNCPTCRLELGKDFEILANEDLQNALVAMFPNLLNN